LCIRLIAAATLLGSIGVGNWAKTSTINFPSLHVHFCEGSAASYAHLFIVFRLQHHQLSNVTAQ
jgi:hypothetical protein